MHESIETFLSADLEPKEETQLRFIYDLARALQVYGTPSDRLEGLVGAVSESFGFETALFATPTAVLLGFGAPPNQRVGLIGVSQGELDLGRLAELDEIAQESGGEGFNAKQASKAVSEVLNAPPRYSQRWRLPSHAILSGSAAFALGGALFESLWSAIAGLFIGILDLAASRSPSLSRLLLPFSASVAAITGVLGGLVTPGLSVAVVGIAGIIFLVPGLTLTIAMKELTTGHLASGTARLSRAFAAFMLLGVGAVLGAGFAELAGVSSGLSVAIPRVWLVAVLAASSPAVLVLLCVRRQDAAFASVAILAALAASELGRWLVSPLFAAGFATFVLGVIGNGWARFRNRPAAVAITPGILLLVPGSVGFRAISAFLAADAAGAIMLSFQVALTAISLVSGLLIANLALPPRKAL